MHDNEKKRKLKMSDLPGVPRVLRLALIPTLNRGNTPEEQKQENEARKRGGKPEGA
jgi:hypothetical protein